MTVFFNKNKSKIAKLEAKIKTLEKHMLELAEQNLKLTKSLVGLQKCVNEFTEVSETVVDNRKLINDLCTSINIILDNIQKDDKQNNSNVFGIITKKIKKLPN